MLRALFVLTLLGGCLPAKVRVARRDLAVRCTNLLCGPGKGSCLYDPSSRALICLCDGGCAYFPR
jgi:hypothetical protein